MEIMTTFEFNILEISRKILNAAADNARALSYAATPHGVLGDWLINDWPQRCAHYLAA